MVLYTLIGAICGGLTAFVVAKVMDANFKSGFGLSSGDFSVMFGIILGTGIGFGIEVSALVSGTHPVQNIFK